MTLMGTTVAEVKANAQRLGLLTLLRPGTAQEDALVTASDVLVLVDGDVEAIECMHMRGSGSIGKGQRVMVLFVEPHGAYVSDSVSAAPTISVVPANGNDAAPVVLSGDGWQPGKPVAFYWDTTTGGSFCEGTADEKGHVDTTSDGCQVPSATSSGPHTIIATQGVRQAQTTFIVNGGQPPPPPPPPPGTATLFVDPSSGPAPSNTSYTGAGWAPGSGPVSVDWDSPATHLADEGVDSMGNIITSSTIVPSGAAAGDHTVTATQGALTAQTIFHVTTGGGSSDPLAGHDQCWVDIPTPPHWGWFCAPSSRIGTGLGFIIAQDVMNWLGPRVCSPWQRPAPTWDFYDSEDQIPAGTWKVGFWGDADVDDTEEPGCCSGCTCCGGYHGWNVDPFAKIFTGHCGAGQSEDMTRGIASHEAAEMIVDPLQAAGCGPTGLSFWVAEDTAHPGNCYVVEVGDPVFNQLYSDPDFGGATFSDVVFPDYFRAGSAGPYDLLGVVNQPFDSDFNGVGPLSHC